ncbi:phosphatidylglycerol lysyltransferase domain-containing protein [Actibacterium sp. XHP0104]|uniref:phosphatidylglycerol lysyltransferase domain-containing protein n=1 Tax=Actibacterium sp. XHP0104 TaxID=2984335 RepID=UPI0021E714A5|nr:phosphatidylglycerol lysyltransferase domain-containing protein [Actibacterium sp. XHP0104]MCV2881060.1 phosphatidylglycerol lysyltransferase domain-containing protein [Actibacterium sp. XHP0104]
MKKDTPSCVHAGTSPQRRVPWLRQLLPFALAALIVVLLRDRLEGIEFSAILAAAAEVTLPQWLAAIAATALSFLAVGRYDGLLHGLMGTGLPDPAARISGASAIAISQTLGFGVVTGTLVRWRLLPGLGAGGAARLTGLVTASFLGGWAVFTGLVLIALPAPSPWMKPLALGALALSAAAIAVSLWAPRLRVMGRAIHLPSLRAMGVILVLTAIDTLAAALALYVLLPDAHAVTLMAFLPAFLLALGAGLLSGTPGGVGPFEMTLLALMPHSDGAIILAAVLAWRVVYYALPACIAALIWLRGPITDQPARPQFLAPDDLAPSQRKAVQSAPRAEAQLLFQGNKRLLTCPEGAPHLVTARLGQSLVSLGDPVAGCPSDAIARLRERARAARLSACIYKCGARTAAHARRAGMTVLPIAQEAWLTPTTFDLNTPAHRQLRRKLRKAQELDIRSGGALPLEEMARINREWAGSNGGERGFSMGLFCPDHLSRQHVIIARDQGRMVAFASFHTGTREWTLDLMRQSSDAPDGTMYALIIQALTDAAAQGVARLSLAAVPFDGPLPDPRLERLRARITPAHSAGLRRFKAAFAPNWETLYIAGPSPLSLSVAGAEIGREILRPAA